MPKFSELLSHPKILPSEPPPPNVGLAQRRWQTAPLQKPCKEISQQLHLLGVFQFVHTFVAELVTAPLRAFPIMVHVCSSTAVALHISQDWVGEFLLEAAILAVAARSSRCFLCINLHRVLHSRNSDAVGDVWLSRIVHNFRLQRAFLSTCVVEN